MTIVGSNLLPPEAGGSQRLEGGRPNALAPKGDCHVRLVLTDQGRPALSILLPARATARDSKAASLLKQALDAGTGADFPIVHEGKPVRGPVCSIGRTERYRAAGVTPSVDLEQDGYSIAARDGDLFLTGGRRRGAISAVIALLEEDLGVRLYSRRSGLQVPELAPVQSIVPRDYAPPSLGAGRGLRRLLHRAETDALDWHPGCGSVLRRRLWVDGLRDRERFRHAVLVLLLRADSRQRYQAAVRGRRGSDAPS